MVECNNKSRRLIMRQTCRIKVLKISFLFYKASYIDPMIERGFIIA